MAGKEMDIYSLLLCKKYDQLSPAELKDLDEMIATDPNVARLWEQVKADTKEVDSNTDDKALWQKLANRIADRQQPATRNIGLSIAMAAAITGIIVAAALFILKSHTTDTIGKHTITAKDTYIQIGKGIVPVADSTACHELKEAYSILHPFTDSLVISSSGKFWKDSLVLVVAPGKTYQVNLPDGSFIKLNAATRIVLWSTGEKILRKANLSGEAYFEVATNPTVPYEVTAAKMALTVLGTSFNVNTYNTSTVVALVKGSVAVRSARKRVLLEAGQKATVTDTIQTATFNKDQVLSWMDGNYEYYNTPLKEISSRIERMYNTIIVLDNENTGKIPLTGNFDKNMTADTWAEATKSVVGERFHYYYKQDTIHINIDPKK